MWRWTQRSVQPEPSYRGGHQLHESPPPSHRRVQTCFIWTLQSLWTKQINGTVLLHVLWPGHGWRPLFTSPWWGRRPQQPHLLQLHLLQGGSGLVQLPHRVITGVPQQHRSVSGQEQAMHEEKVIVILQVSDLCVSGHLVGLLENTTEEKIEFMLCGTQPCAFLNICSCWMKCRMS